MGQYYNPVLLTASGASDDAIVAWFNAHNYGNGMKMMEHAFISNNFVAAVEAYIHAHRELGLRLVWAGDYSEMSLASQETRASPNGVRLATYEPGTDDNLHHLCDDTKRVDGVEAVAGLRYIVNHTKRCYIDKTKAGEIHPLPLLTSETHQTAGGDYRGTHEHLLGSWARDVITVDVEKPDDAEFHEMVIQFKDDWS
jgi:hypothetical protein